MLDKAVIETQLEFYRSGNAGCLFAAHAAGDPEKYEWRLSVCDADAKVIDALTREAIDLPHVSTQSIIFPSVASEQELGHLITALQDTRLFFLGREVTHGAVVCLGYRVRVGDKTSWATGFGSFEFLPRTRQAVFTEIVFRSKPRPIYEWVMKKAPENVIHLADMDMKGMSENKFKSLWYGSLDNTEKILGHKPDLRSAAKTTFALPVSLWRELRTVRP